MSSDDDQLLQLMEMEGKLTKIRTQINSKLDNQKHLAVVLQAIEENLQEQNQKKTPVAYFVSFLSLLDQSCQGDEISDVNMATSALYFLDIVSPCSPKTLLKSKFSEILTRIAPALTNDELEAPLIRSSIGVLETILSVQDNGAWINTSKLKISPERGLQGLLQLALDPRPKVRKRAQEAVNHLLSNPPAGPSPDHPAALLCGTFALESITQLLEEQQKQSHKKANSKESNSQLIHNLQLITAITNANQWSLKLITPLCDVLLEISKTSDQYLISSAFSAFEGLFKSMTTQIDNDKFVQVLDVMFDLKPALNDQHLTPSWLAVIAKAVTSYSKNIDPLSCFLKLPQIFKIVGEFFQSDVQNICISASQCLIAIIVDSVDAKLLLNPPAMKPEVYEQIDATITELAEITLEFLSVKYRNSAKEVCELVANIFSVFKTRCNPDFFPHLEIVGEWRSNEQDGFELNEVSESVIAMAISSVGPEAVLGTLPLNLNKPNAVGRAWLLPILRDNVRCASLGFYIREILPMVKFFDDKAKKLGSNSVNGKIFATIVDQIWSLLPHFCDLPNDLTSSFTEQFASQLSQLLYEKVELRTTICHALKMLVESNVVYSSGEIEEPLLNQDFPVAQSKKDLEYLSTKMANNLLSVLFNVFSQTPMEQRGFVLESIDAYLKISKPEDLAATFNKVCELS
ncbi:unnamed protein product [Ambrosiozyma monospora]|uniref:Unnamed protein product n=1 Tax=Ambrosiozyma monospora TaxID=43982 RepID=A0A9W6Z0Q6_AMBMO|nr:unnamed protein product [Ambrosiozyma monospora]